MKSVFKVLTFLILSFSFIVQSFAIEAPTNLTSVSNTESSVSLSWDTVDTAVMYYVLYSTESWVENGYSNNTDLFENNFIDINDLEVWLTYYFTVISFDENWDESIGSPELIINLGSGDVTNNFMLETVNVISSDVIELDFSENLDNWDNPAREFKISNSLNDFDRLEVISSELSIDDNSKITLILDKELIEWNEYEVVIIAINSALGDNIESWIDNAIKFIANIPAIEDITNNEDSDVIVNPDWSTYVINSDWSTTTTNIDGTITTINSDGKIVEDEIELNSAAEEQDWVSWIDIAAEDIENTALYVAENNSNLPKTWPEHILMLILSIILWILIFVFKYKKA